MKRAIIAILAAVGGLVILGILFVVAMSWAVLGPTPMPNRVVLELDLERGLIEGVRDDPFTLAFESPRPNTRQLAEALEAAAEDDRVVGLLVRGGTGPGGWARIEEVRDAVLRFREGGKSAVFFAETFGEGGGGQGSYYLASAFDEVVLQPSGDVGLMPLVAEMPFLREMLEKLDVEPHFDARAEYKDAMHLLTERGFTEESREATQALLESILDTMVEGIAEGRSLAADSVRALVRDGPHMAVAAESAGLVDRLGYLDEARAIGEALGGEGGAERLGFREYHDRSGRAWNQGPRIALVYGIGAIQRGRGGWDPITGAGSFGAAAVAENLRSAVADDRVRGILFRVESPGGSYVASDLVRREIALAREAGKPVVVSMGVSAASGGYLVATDADRIVAHPTTLTGSIGVAGGKLATRELWERAGIEWERVEAGGSNSWASAVDGFSEAEWTRFQGYLDRVYEEFVGHVAAGRGMDAAAVDEVARGRVWSGRDARDLGLVDALGGFPTALAEMRDLLELEEGAPLLVATHPPERGFLELLMEDGWRVGVRTAIGGGGAGAVSDLLEGLRPALVRLRGLGILGDDPALLRMPPLEVPAP